MHTDATLSDRLAPGAALLARLLEQRSDLDAHIEEVKATLRATVPGPDVYTAGELSVVVTSNRRLDVDAAAAAVVATGVDPDAVRKVAWDPTKLRQHLTPQQAEAFMVEQGEARVSLR